jgi:hypothetical protein
VVDQFRDAALDGLRSTRNNELRSLGATEPDISEYLYESGCCAIAHASADPIVDPDNVSDQRRLSEDLYIVKEIAEHLIELELKVSRVHHGVTSTLRNRDV